MQPSGHVAFWGLRTIFFESAESLDSTDAAQALAASAFGQSWTTCPDFPQ